MNQWDWEKPVQALLRSEVVNCRRVNFMLLFLDLYFWYELHGASDSSAQCTLTADYYNRSVSGWEPFVEPWK